MDATKISTTHSASGVAPLETLESLCRDYRRMETTLAWLVENFDAQPSLETIAGVAGLTPFHFQRLFSRWVGVTPKKFVQFLSLARAKHSLDDSRSVLEAAFDAGLSGPGRLHDLFVGMDAVTPGEYRRRGEGMVVRYGRAPSPFGESLLLWTERGINGLAFVGPEEGASALARLSRGWEKARFVEDAGGAAEQAARVFRAGRVSPPDEPLRLLVRGTRFQVKVWEALLRVPPGAVISYAGLARRIGAPAAVRAVAGAAAANDIAYLIPCHRVIRKCGELGGYRWGLERKLAMLSAEFATCASRA
ncbi:MAG: methylated-DNA--[protein]-cysteine S-methyltransferase [Gammaproteobacteria bacterium]|nr:methylated-DNA--[protein]-cysteine S-methyltransferase [Gammaproteobacteria bacterium]